MSNPDMITLAQITKLFPHLHTPDDLARALNRVLPRYKIDEKQRVAAFLAQTGHESAQYTRLSENLNYSAEGLLKTFPKYFPSIAVAKQYERQAQRIANHVYANRMGNGNEASGDGWKFRGRGALQITGKSNYEGFATSLGLPIDEALEYCNTLGGAVESACWFWQKNRLNLLCDNQDFTALTKRINGGVNGLEERKALYQLALEIL